MAIALIITKEWFFDSPRVMSRISATTASTLGKIGAMVRIIARRSIRKRKKASNVGEPPSSHEGSLRERIFFVFDPDTESVVIGAERFNHVNFFGTRPVYGAVPRVLEEGGSVKWMEYQQTNGNWRRCDFRSPRRMAGRPRRFVTRQHGPRPFMKPALETSQERYAHLWAETWSSGRVTDHGRFTF